MSNNKTSQAVEQILSKSENHGFPIADNGMSYIIPMAEIQGISKKYKALEGACKWSRAETHCEENCQCVVCDALYFDPLSDV